MESWSHRVIEVLRSLRMTLRSGGCRSADAVSRRLAPESRLLSPFFGARSEIIRWSSIDARYLRAYGKSKYQQDTDRAGTRAEAIIKKGTLACSALNQGQNGTIDPTLPGTRSSLAERIASGCGRSPATLFAAPAGTLPVTCLRNPRLRLVV